MVNGYAAPSVHALLIEPFKSIWEKDTSLNNEKSIQIFTYVELVCSPKNTNPFMGYTDEEERSRKVKEAVWKDPDYPITEEVMWAVLRYKELLADSSPAYGLYIDAITSINKLRVFLREFDINERTPTGSMVLKPKDLTNALKDLDEVSRNLELSKDRVHNELTQMSKTRNQREIGYFER